jgi:hypothetical protein
MMYPLAGGPESSHSLVEADSILADERGAPPASEEGGRFSDSRGGIVGDTLWRDCSAGGRCFCFGRGLGTALVHGAESSVFAIGGIDVPDPYAPEDSKS